MSLEIEDPEQLKNLLITVERQACLNSFYEFFLSFWSEVSAEVLKDNWHIKYICDELQYLSVAIKERKEKPHDLVINVPPGSTKTTIVLQLFPAWLWAIDPTIRIISSSHSATLSTESAVKSRDVISSAKYQVLFPHVKIRKDDGAKQSYGTTRGGARITTSTGGSITGRHAHIKLMDDLQDAKKADSLADREAAKAHMKALFTREIEKGSSINVLIMQRLHEKDCTAYLTSLTESRAVKHIRLPAELTTGATVVPAELRARYVNGLLDPVRMSPHILSQKKTELGSFQYSSQFQQDPTPPEGIIVKRKDFKIVPRESVCVNAPYEEPVLFWADTAYEEKSKKKAKGEAVNDPTGLMATWIKDGICYILDYQEVYMKMPALVRHVPAWVNQNFYSERSSVLIEPKASGKSTVQCLQAFTKLNVGEIKINGQKDSKMTELSNTVPTIEAGRFMLVDGAWNDLFLDRVCGFPAAAHDEAVDLLCYARRHYFDNDNGEAEDAAYEQALRLLGC